ncbi:MAG: TIGR03087 family PEP-CTERM/XrtA system glycosyltransferase [Alphaproteobacteria bacterium]|nr:MAG: TIGR03087 family PEP-CTERM/XrtA system glycosyltransferase [Alphaproteobacteria bacterium]
MARILFLAHRIPFPPNKGDKIRSWHFLEHLMTRHTVHLGFYVDDPRDMVHVPALEKQVASLCCQQIGRTTQKLLALRGLLTGRPLSLAAYPSGKLQAYAKSLIEAGQLDLIFLYSGATAPLVLDKQGFVGGLPVVADLVDVDSAKWTAYAAASRPPLSWLYAREGHLLAAFEAQVAALADATLLVSEAEAELFRSRAAGARNVRAVPNGVNLSAFDPGRFSPCVENGVPTVIFTGAMDYRPNIEAVTWFCRHVWPLVRAGCPDARFLVAGGPSPSAVTPLASAHDGIEILGYVDDMAAAIHAADLVVAPLLTARGLQNKVLEGMAMAKPVVATSAAFEGLQAAAGDDLVRVDGAPDFAAAVLALLGNRPARARLGVNARRYVETQHQWSRQLDRLNAIIAKALESRT